jgi:hypothetical protein
MIEHPTLNHIGLDWAGDTGQDRGKSFSSRTEGEAGFASDCMEIQSNPFPDFSINHQCKDFNTLVQRRKENSVNTEKWITMEKPNGVR